MRRLLYIAAAAAALGACSPQAYRDGELLRTCPKSIGDLYRYQGKLYLADSLGATRIAGEAKAEDVCR